ncbi:PDGLE domain-containing protein [bacterium]|nr:PDGLE domain-containing protein [FCB group bacterium]MBL7190227.1 PDGLE domain-containing protein [bacterium]
MKYKYFIAAGLILALLTAFLLSQFASQHPDGLEKTAEDLGFLNEADGAEVWQNSPAPDYVFPGISNEKIAVGAAGIAGTLLVFGLALLTGYIARKKQCGS